MVIADTRSDADERLTLADIGENAPGIGERYPTTA
jgi:hypothetical protein